MLCVVSKEVDVNTWITVILIMLVVAVAGGGAALLMRGRRRQRPARMGLPELGTLTAERPANNAAPPKERAISLSGRNAQHLVNQAVLRSNDNQRNTAEASPRDNVQRQELRRGQPRAMVTTVGPAVPSRRRRTSGGNAVPAGSAG